MTGPATPEFRPEAPEFRANPYAAYKAFRDIHPVLQRSEQGDWIVTGHAAVKQWLGGPRPEKPNQASVNQAAAPHGCPMSEMNSESIGKSLGNSADYHFNHGLQKTSPPYHTHLRKIIGGYFSREYFHGLKPVLRAITDGLLNRPWPRRELDVNEDFAFPFTSSVICHILGLPLSDRTRLREWSYNYQLAANLLHSKKDLLRRNLSLAGMASYLQPFILERMNTPLDDFISYLAQQHVQGHISYDALIGNIMTLILGGFENTQNGIGLAVYHLLRHDEQLQLLRDTPELLPLAVEECLRFDPPVQCFYTDNYQGMLEGQHIELGQRVHILFGAANRDPDVFPQPDVFDITRKNNPHLTLGTGIHYCLGAHLARMEIECALESLLLRFPQMTLRDQNLYLNPLFSIKSVKHVFVEF